MSKRIFFLILICVIEKSTCGPTKKSLCTFHAHSLTCRKHLPSIEYPLNIEHVELKDIDWPELDLSDFVAKFPYVKKLTVMYGKNVTKVVAPPADNHIELLRLNHLHLTNLNREVFDNLTKLRRLDLRFNKLKVLPTNMHLKSIEEIDLSGNRWNCSLNLSWILELNKTILKDVDNITCHDEPYPAKPLYPIAKILENIDERCPRECACALPKVVIEPETNVLEPIIAVDCASRGLARMPATLPARARILDLRGNEIADVAPLRDDAIYATVTDVYLDRNRVATIKQLEGSAWLTRFRVLSLKANRIAQIPTYAIDNALQQNPNMPNAVRMNLGGNPWRCDCPFTPVFQEMIRKYTPQIGDIMDIRCSYNEQDENSFLPIIQLSRNSVCRLTTEYTVQVLDLINIVLAVLIVLVLSKLAYDYYYFKKTGRLPWIVTKMP